VFVSRYGIESTDAFRLAIETSAHGVVVVDTDGVIVLVNAELERQFGYAREELVGQNVDALVPDALRGSHAALRERFAQAPQARPMGTRRELTGRRKDGTLFPVDIGLHPVRIEDGMFVVASVADISERRIDDAERATLEEQLEFERLLADLSFQFINLPEHQVSNAIRRGLGRISQQLGLDQSAFFKVDPDSALFDLVSWTAPDLTPTDAPVPDERSLPELMQRIRGGEVFVFATLDQIPSASDRAAFEALGIKSAVIVPLSVDGLVVGAVGFQTLRSERTWSPEVLHRLKVSGSVFDQVLARLQRDAAVRAASQEEQRLRDQLEAENQSLRREARERLGPTRVVGQSPGIRRVLELVHQVAPTDSTVLILGETGTGKELFASLIHEHSARGSRPMVRVNCAAIPTTLIESELFGREKGAFTGALARQVGRFELADRSTIFLDEIGDLPPDVQVKLLRVLEERVIERLGSPRPIPVDTRIIAATHRNLEQRVQDGTFREDLYYRLNVFPIHIPPLRERVEDIPLLVWRFVEEISKAFGKRIDSIDKDNLAALQQYGWPGNIRELRNVVERALIVAATRRLTIPSPQTSAAVARRSPKLVDVEKEHIRGVLESTGWRIRGAGGAADRLGMKPTTLETRMAKLGLKRPRLS
jgi:PAS domain S-box-containing protein